MVLTNDIIQLTSTRVVVNLKLGDVTFNKDRRNAGFNAASNVHNVLPFKEILCIQRLFFHQCNLTVKGNRRKIPRNPCRKPILIRSCHMHYNTFPQVHDLSYLLISSPSILQCRGLATWHLGTLAPSLKLSTFPAAFP